MPTPRPNPEGQHLLARAQANGYVTTDRCDEYDAVAEAYRDWCQEQQQPYLEIALGDATSRLTLSLIEADKRFRKRTERRLRKELAHYCLSDDGIVIEDDFCIAERVENERLQELLAWLRRVAIDSFPVYL